MTYADRNVNFAQVSLTLDFAYMAGGPGEPKTIEANILEKLNANPDVVKVTASNVTGWLDWPESLDPPVGKDHADHASEIALLDKVSHWLTLDRKALISALIRAESASNYQAYRLAEAEKAVAKLQAQAAEFKTAHDLFETAFAKLNADLAKGDLSDAQFPHVGEEARIELTARQSQTQWVLEMLPNPNKTK